MPQPDEEMTSTSHDWASSWPVDGLWGLSKHEMQNYHVPHPCPEPVLGSIPLDLSQSARAGHQGSNTTGPGGGSCVSPDGPHDEKAQGPFILIPNQQIMDGRAYACHNCLRPGGKAFSVAYSNYARNIWGIDGPGRLHDGIPTPLLGCSCGQRLVQSTLCRSHQFEGASNWAASTQQVTAWMNQIWGAKVCPFCLSHPTGESPIDAYGFIGRSGGEDLPEVIYVCLSCQDIVVAPREFGTGPIPGLTQAVAAPPPTTAPVMPGRASHANMGMDGSCSAQPSDAGSEDDVSAANDAFDAQFAAGLWDGVAAAQNRVPSPQGLVDPLDVDMGDMRGFIVTGADSAAALPELYQGSNPQVSPPRITAPSPVVASSPRHPSPDCHVTYDDWLRFSPSTPADTGNADGSPHAGDVGDAPNDSAFDADLPSFGDDTVPADNNFDTFAEDMDTSANDDVNDASKSVAPASCGVASSSGGDTVDFPGGDGAGTNAPAQPSQATESDDENHDAGEGDTSDTDFSWIPSAPCMSWAEAQAIAAAAGFGGGAALPVPVVAQVPPARQQPAHPAPFPAVAIPPVVASAAESPRRDPAPPASHGGGGAMTPAQALLSIERARQDRAAYGEAMSEAEAEMLYRLWTAGPVRNEVVRAVYTRAPAWDNPPAHPEPQPEPEPEPEPETQPARRGRGRPRGSRNVNRGRGGRGGGGGRGRGRGGRAGASQDPSPPPPPENPTPAVQAAPRPAQLDPAVAAPFQGGSAGQTAGHMPPTALNQQNEYGWLLHRHAAGATARPALGTQRYYATGSVPQPHGYYDNGYAPRPTPAAAAAATPAQTSGEQAQAQDPRQGHEYFPGDSGWMR